MRPAQPARNAHATAALAAAVGAGLGLGVGALLVYSLSNTPAAATTTAADVESRLEALAQRVDALERRPGGDRAATLSGTAGERTVAGGVDRDLLAHMVEEQLRAHGVLTAAEVKPDPDAEFSADRAVQLLTAAASDTDRAALWERVRKAGRLDEVLARFERMVAENPRDADARVELGLAYVQKMLAMPDGPERAKVGAQIDQAFTSALEIDPDHWEARFRKAEGLSYWPPLAGKTGEAIANFERLVQQQDQHAPRAEEARTYLYLGNLYERQGQLDKAAATWAKGAQRHPGDAELQQRLQSVRR